MHRDLFGRERVNKNPDGGQTDRWHLPNRQDNQNQSNSSRDKPVGVLPLPSYSKFRSDHSAAVDIASLPIAQLTQVRNQLTQEVSHLTNSFQQLKEY